MPRRLGPATTSYYHRSGPRRDADEEDDVAFDYDYYETYDDYTRSRAARESRSRAGAGSRGIDGGGDGPLHDSSDDDDRYARRRRGGGGGSSHDDPRATRSRDINLHSPRLAAAAAGSYFGARNGSSRRDERDDLASQKPRSMPTDVSKAPPIYATPRGRPPLPPGWLPLFSATHDRWYYVNKASGKPQWEAPGFEVKKVQEQQRERDRQQKQKDRDVSQRSLAPRDASPGGGSGRSHSRNSRRSSGLSITGMLLGAAGGIAAGTLVAKALKKDGSDRSIKPRGSRSDTSSAGDRRRDRDGRRNDRTDFEEDNVPSYRHGHGGSHSPGHGSDHGHGFGGHGHGHGSDDDDD